MIKILKKIDETLLELILGIGLWGVLCELVGVWFVKEKTYYSLGVLAGCLIAAAAAVHMWWALDRALSPGQTAEKVITAHSMVRYVFIVAAFAILCVTDVANPLSAFLGIMGLKAGAYLQPFLYKLLHRKERGAAESRGEKTGQNPKEVKK